MSFLQDSETRRVELVVPDKTQRPAGTEKGMVTVQIEWVTGAPGTTAHTPLLRDEPAMQHPHARTVRHYDARSDTPRCDPNSDHI